ncbi:MAG: hypothetical protein D4R67_07730 [Bacteroidetes bacterium]|nr:MAG: hypothetical protein D4R67_07730 [Bacteroidota bacterium]
MHLDLLYAADRLDPPLSSRGPFPFCPLFGVYFYELMGFTGTFLLTLAALLAAMALMRWTTVFFDDFRIEVCK